jgi:hypothetical protein
MISASSGEPAPDFNNDDNDYAALLAALRSHVQTATGPLFTTDASGLYDAFLNGLETTRRQVYTCAVCRRFVESFGALATIGDAGELRSWLWHAPGVPARFAAAVKAMARLVDKAQVTGVFLSSERAWGLAENTSKRTGITWQHMAIVAPAALVHKASPIQTATQAAAEIAQERLMVERALNDFPLDVAVQARTLLKSGNLARSEKADAIATWFVELHERLDKAKGVVADRLMWHAAATAPTGFAHLRGGMLGTLLEDVQSKVPFDVLRAKWAAKMDPLQYMRPQAAPGAGNIAAAEKIIAALGSAGALARRFARLEEVQALWKPAPKAEPTKGGVFGHLAPKSTKPAAVAQPPVVMTFEKFRRQVLPEAAQIEVLVPEKGGFIALVTAVNPDAPPLLQWDREDRRNPVNWYVYPGGSPAAQWGVSPGFREITALTLLPSMWGGEHGQAHQGKGLIFLLRDCRDSNDAGIALFPEVLKSEYRAIRATLEAHSKGAKLEGRAEASACGLDLRAGATWNQEVRVTDRRGAQTTYKLDRWD